MEIEEFIIKMRYLAVLISVMISINVNANNDVSHYIKKCLPPSHWEVMKKIVRVESENKLYAIGINAKGYKSLYPASIKEAQSHLMEINNKGLSFDIGLAQISSQHFKKNRIFYKKGFTIFDALEPCLNLKMGAVIFSDFYRKYGNVADALSAYNTGSATRGYENGYVARFID